MCHRHCLGVVGGQAVDLLQPLLDVANVGDVSLYTRKGRGERRASLSPLAVDVDVRDRAFDDDEAEQPCCGDVLRGNVGPRGDEPLVEIKVSKGFQDCRDISNANAPVFIATRDLLKRKCGEFRRSFDLHRGDIEACTPSVWLCAGFKALPGVAARC